MAQPRSRLLALIGLLAGCGGSGPAGGPESATPSPAVPGEGAAPEAQKSELPALPAPVDEVALSRSPGEKSPYYVAMTITSQELSVHDVGGRHLVAASDWMSPLPAQTQFYWVTGAGLGRGREVMAGLPYWSTEQPAKDGDYTEAVAGYERSVKSTPRVFAIEQVTGKGRKLEGLVLRYPDNRLDSFEKMEWRAGRWVSTGEEWVGGVWPFMMGPGGGGPPPWGIKWHGGTNLFERYLVGSDWTGLSLGTHELEIGPDQKLRRTVGRDFVIEGGNGREFMPRRSNPIPGCECKNAVCEMFGEVFPDKSMINVARHCNGGLGAEHWKAGAATPRVMLLPGSKKVVMSTNYLGPQPEVMTHARGPKDVLVVASLDGGGVKRPYVARFDGAKWLNITPKGVGTGETALREHLPDGSLVLSVGDELWHRSAKGQWVNSAPKGAKEFRSTWASPAGQLWAQYGSSLHRYEGGARWTEVLLPKAPKGKGWGPRYVPSMLHFAGNNAKPLIIAAAPPDDQGRPTHVVLVPSRPTRVWSGPEVVAPELASLAGLKESESECASAGLVVLESLSATPKPDRAYWSKALGRAGVSGLRLIEMREGPVQVLAATVPNSAGLTSLLAHLKTLPDYVGVPTPLCGKPKAGLEIPLHGSTP